jgi:hypothetical protein
VDTVFLAGVVAMGSAAITGKSLMELQKFSSPETEFLLGGKVETRVDDPLTIAAACDQPEWAVMALT